MPDQPHNSPHTTSPAPGKGGKLRKRVLSGVVLFGSALLAAVFLQGLGGWAVLVAIGAVAQLEFYAMINMPGIPVFRYVGTLCGVALISATFLTIGPTAADAAMAYRWEHFVLVGSLILVFLRQLPLRPSSRDRSRNVQGEHAQATRRPGRPLPAKVAHRRS